METSLLPATQTGALERALAVLRHGGVVAFPTDTVYGVGALAFDRAAVQKIYAAKGRDAAKALPILLPDAEALALVVERIPAPVQLLVERFWPGPLTIVLKKRGMVPEEVSPGQTVGVRMPDHPVALSLLREAGPMAATSANPSAGADPLTADDVLKGLGGRIDLILDGGTCPGGIASTVVDCTVDPPLLLRQGPIPLSSVLAVLAGSSG